MIEYIASFLAGALLMCIGALLFLLKSHQSTSSETPVVDTERPASDDIPDYVEEAKREADETPPDPHPDDDGYVDEYNSASERLHEEIKDL